MLTNKIVWAALMLSAAAITMQAQNPVPPFLQCPPVGLDTSCRILIVIGANGGQRILTDPGVSATYDGADDTLIGVLNLSKNPVSSIPLVSTTNIFGFDGDGICDMNPKPAACPFGPNHYEGPGVSFSNINVSGTSGLVKFNPPIAANGGTSYFGLEEAIPTSCPDADGDGLCDDWEKNGLNVFVNGANVFINLPAMGADPNHKDIFIQGDYMNSSNYFCVPVIGCLFGHTHKPEAAAVALVIQAFANAPVANPDGTMGITLHLDCGSDCIMNPKTGATWGAFSKAVVIPEQVALGSAPGGNYNWNGFDALKTPNFLPTGRQQVFHYLVLGHNLGGLDGTSGISRGIGASDYLVTLGSWPNQTGTTQQQAGTIMHELGHNLNLQHGGTDSVNYKPNFLSIMSYLFQTRGLVINGTQGTIDYSRFALPGLNEAALNETVGLAGGAAIATYGTSFFCQGAASSTLVPNANGQIDWNCNGNPAEVAVARDINQDAARTILTSSNDWTNLVYNGGGIGGLGLSLTPPQFTPATTELTPSTDAQIATTLQVTVGGPGITQMLPGTSTTLSFTVTNSGTQNDSYALTTASTAAWADFSSVPASLALTSGASRQFTIPVTVPAGAPFGTVGSFSLRAVSVSSATISDTRTASITVTPIAITAAPVDGRSGAAYGPVPLAAAGGTAPYTWSATGLPAGVALSAGGILSGTPTTVGVSNSVITVTDSASVSKSQSYAITIAPAATVNIANPSLPTVPVGGVFGPVTLSASGGTGPYLWWATDLPAGVDIDPLTGILSGNPAGAGQFSVTVTATDSNSASVSQVFPVTIAPALTGGGGGGAPVLLDQSIAFPAIADRLATDAPFTVSASASSGLPVTFTVINGPATISGNTVTLNGLGTVTLEASQAGSTVYAPATARQTFTVSLGTATITAVQNAASLKSGPLSPGSFAAIFGSNLASGSVIGDDRTAQKLNGATVTIKDAGGQSFTANLSFVSFKQINFVMPNGVAIGAATLSVVNGAGNSATFPIAVAAISPAIFTADASGTGVPAAAALSVANDGTLTQLNPFSCSLVCSPLAIQIPATGRTYLVLFGTGIRGASSLAGVKVTMGGQTGNVTYAGPQGTFPGLDQVNVLLPLSLAGAGTVDLVLTVDGVAANTVKVAFR